MFSSYWEKPLPHYTWGDWQSYNKNLETITDKKNIIGNNVRQEAQQLRSATRNTIDWKLKDTNSKLGDRISDVDQWFRNLDRTLKEVTEAVDRLSEAKLEVERSIAANLPLHEAAKESLNIRDRRREIDLVEDDAYRELKKEVDLIDKVQNRLRDCARHDWDHLVKLKEQRDKLDADLSDKDLALRIDRYQLSLTPNDTDRTSFKPWPADACSAGQCPVSLETWLKNCLDRRKAAEDAVAMADRASNNSWNLIRRTDNDIKAQREASDFALRRRRHETLQARDSLANQRKDLMDEIERLEREMMTLEKAVNDTRGNLKLVHTRLESRKFRPRLELCRDHPTVGLEEELRHIGSSREHLGQQLKDLKNVLNTHRQHLHEIEDDLQRKERSLALETACIEAHARPAKAPYQTDIAWLAPTATGTCGPSANYFLNESVDRGTHQRILDRQLGNGDRFRDAEYLLVD